LAGFFWSSAIPIRSAARAMAQRLATAMVDASASSAAVSSGASRIEMRSVSSTWRSVASLGHGDQGHPAQPSPRSPPPSGDIVDCGSRFLEHTHGQVRAVPRPSRHEQLVHVPCVIDRSGISTESARERIAPRTRPLELSPRASQFARKTGRVRNDCGANTELEPTRRRDLEPSESGEAYNFVAERIEAPDAWNLKVQGYCPLRARKINSHIT
jgi:hypothetical protein